MSEEIKAPAPQALSMDKKTQLIIAKDNSELVRMIKIFMAGVALPKTLDTEAKIITAWQAAASLKVPPIIAIQNMAIIHGSLSMWGQLPKALAEQTGQMEEFKLILFDEEQNEICLANKNLKSNVWGAVTQMRRSKKSKNEYFFTEIEAKKAGLLGKSGPWQDYRKIMYARRTIAHAVKFEFPDAVMGIGIAEYDHHEAPDLRDVAPSRETNDLQSARDTIRRAKEIPAADATLSAINEETTCQDSMPDIELDQSKEAQSEQRNDKID